MINNTLIPPFFYNLNFDHNYDQKISDKIREILEKKDDKQFDNIINTNSTIINNNIQSDKSPIVLIKLQKIYNDTVNNHNEIVKKIAKLFEEYIDNDTNWTFPQFDTINLEVINIISEEGESKLIHGIIQQIEFILSHIENMTNKVVQIFDDTDIISGGGKIQDGTNKMQEIKHKIDSITDFFNNFLSKNKIETNEFDKHIDMYDKLSKSIEFGFFTPDMEKIILQKNVMNHVELNINDIISMETTDKTGDAVDIAKLQKTINENITKYKDMINKITRQFNEMDTKTSKLNEIIMLNDIKYTKDDFIFTSDGSDVEIYKKLKSNTEQLTILTVKMNELIDIDEVFIKNDNSKYTEFINTYNNLLKNDKKIIKPNSLSELDELEKSINSELWKPIKYADKLIFDINTNAIYKEYLKNKKLNEIILIFEFILNTQHTKNDTFYEIIKKKNTSLQMSSDIKNKINAILRSKLNDITTITLLKSISHAIDEADILYLSSLIQSKLNFSNKLKDFKNTNLYKKMQKYVTKYNENIDFTNMREYFDVKNATIKSELNNIIEENKSLEVTKKQFKVDPKYFTNISKYLLKYLEKANEHILKSIKKINNIKKEYQIQMNFKELNYIDTSLYTTKGGGTLTNNQNIKQEITKIDENYNNLLSKLIEATSVISEFKQIFNAYIKNRVDILEKNLYVSYYIIYLGTIIREASDEKFTVYKYLDHDQIIETIENIDKLNFPYLTATINRMKQFGIQLKKFFEESNKEVVIVSNDKKSFIDLLTFIHLSTLVSTSTSNLNNSKLIS